VRAAGALEASLKEVTQLMDRGAIIGRLRRQMTPEEVSKIISAHCFLKEKEKADGAWDKTKARLVAGGHMIDGTMVGETYAPVCLSVSTTLMINYAAIDGDEISSADIDGAYLLPRLNPEEPKIHIRVDKHLAAIIVQARPEMAEFLEPDGTMILELGRYLYGLPQSGNRFYRFLKAVFMSMGCIPTPEDQCQFARGSGAQRMLIATHVDDMLCKGTTRSTDLFYAELKTKFRITIERGPALSFVGIAISRLSPNDIVISQTGYRRTILSRFSADIAVIKRKQTSPCVTWLTEPVPASDPPTDARHLLSILMSIMFLARFTRADCLFPVCYLATKTSKPTVQHYLHACRLLKYIQDMGNYGIRYRRVDGGRINFNIYSDASEVIYPSGHGQCGVFVTIGSGYIGCRCSQIHMVTLSSKEAEQYAGSEAGTWVKFVRAVTPNYGHTINSVKMWFDSTAAIADTKKEGQFSRNKHITYRKGFVREIVANGEASVDWMPTTDMPADFLTKPSGGAGLFKLMKSVGMVKIAD
jgi:hypothetical protein